MDRHHLTKKIKLKALELGFSNIGITTADDFNEYYEEVTSREDYDIWLNKVAFIGKGAKPTSFFP